MQSEVGLVFFGVTAAIFNTVALLPYLRDILRRRTKPERASWWVWLALGVVALWAQASAGAMWSLAFTAAGVTTVAVIAVLSIPYGYGRFHMRNFMALLIAAIGVVISLMLKDSTAAIVVVIGVDAVGMWLTFRKAWHAPYSETLVSWVLATIGGVFGVLAAEHITFSTVGYPAYIVLVQGILVVELIYRRSRVAPAATPRRSKRSTRLGI